MAIANNITREHVFQAMLKIKCEEVLPDKAPREWALNYEKELYPANYLSLGEYLCKWIST